MDFSKLFPNLKKTTEKELKDKEKSLSVGDHVSVVKNIRCKQAGKSGVITKINPENKYGWKSFVVKFDDSKYGSMAFQSGYLNKTAQAYDKKKWPKYDDFQKERHDKAVELARKIIEEHYKKMHQWGAKTEKGFLSKGKVNNSNRDDVIIRGGKNILKQHRGTCHELSNARLKLLRDAGIDAHRVFNFYGVGQDNDGLLGHSMVIFRGDDGKLHFASPHMADKNKRTSFGDFDSIEDAVNQYMAVMKDKNMGGEFSDDDFVEIHDTTDMDIPNKIKFRDFLHKALKGRLLYSQGR